MSVLSRWKSRLRTREKLLKAARARYNASKTAANAKVVRLREKQVSDAKKIVARHTKRPKLTSTVSFDGVPMFRGHALMLKDARAHGWKGRANSADRRRGVAERYGKLSQAALYAGWIAHKAGFNPANPPGRSTHELRSDAVAYRGPVGRPLSWWQLGLDTSNADQLRNVLTRLGYAPFRPYAVGSEIHHTNLRKSPYRNLKKRGLA